MLLLAIPSIWPYGFYQLLRWIVSVTGIFNVYRTYQMNLISGSVVMVFVTILFNPIAPITFSKGIWVLIDLAVAVIMFVLVPKFKETVN